MNIKRAKHLNTVLNKLKARKIRVSLQRPLYLEKDNNVLIKKVWSKGQIGNRRQKNFLGPEKNLKADDPRKENHQAFTSRAGLQLNVALARSGFRKRGGGGGLQRHGESPNSKRAKIPLGNL